MAAHVGPGRVAGAASGVTDVAYVTYMGPQYLRVLVSASRSWRKPLDIWTALGHCLTEAQRQGKTLVVVHGDADGGDQIAKLFGQVHEGAVDEPHPADWDAPCRPWSGPATANPARTARRTVPQRACTATTRWPNPGYGVPPASSASAHQAPPAALPPCAGRGYGQ